KKMKNVGRQCRVEEPAYIQPNDNPVSYSVMSNYDVIADCDEDDVLVGLDLLSPRNIPSLEEIELYVDIDLFDEAELESELWELGCYTQIEKIIRYISVLQKLLHLIL